MQPGNNRFFLIPPKKSLLKSSYPQKYLPNFRAPKDPGIENFNSKKIFRSTPSLEMASTTLGCSRCRKKNSRCVKCVSHVQHDFFSSFNQSDHCFVAYSLSSSLPRSQSFSPPRRGWALSSAEKSLGNEVGPYSSSLVIRPLPSWNLHRV